MAKRRRRRSVRRARARNPRRRRRSSYRRRHNPVVYLTAPKRRRSRRSSGRKRHHRRGRRRNPTAMRIGEVFKEMVYGAGGAILTRAGAAAVSGFLPSLTVGGPFMPAITQAFVAVVPVRWAGKKFLGPRQGDLMMLGGLISAGLQLADAYFPQLQSQITGILRAPVQIAGQVGGPAALPSDAAMAGYADVEDVDSSVFSGLGDVEDIPQGIY